jgi:large subunit ribosomal protein L10
MTKLGQIYRQGLNSQLQERLGKRDNIFVLNFSGVASSAMSDLRKELKRQGARLVVVRNSIVKMTLKKIQMESLEPSVSGSVALVYSDSDAVTVSKTLMKFVKDHETSKVQGGLLNKGILSVDDIKRLSSLPSKEILLSMLLAAIQSPISSLTYVLGYKIRALLYTLKQISEKKQ